MGATTLHQSVCLGPLRLPKSFKIFKRKKRAKALFLKLSKKKINYRSSFLDKEIVTVTKDIPKKNNITSMILVEQLI